MTGLSGATPSMTAGDLVNDAWVSWKREASDLAARSESFLTDIQDVNVSPINTAGVVLDLAGISLPNNYSVPSVPTADELVIASETIPGVPTGNFVTAKVDSAPQFTGTIESMDYRDAPVFTGTVPSTNVDLVIPDVPQVPAFVYPDAPDTTISAPDPIVDVGIPVITAADIPSWEADAPISNISTPNIQISYTDETYSSSLLDDLTSKVTEMLGNSVGIPDAIWNAIYDQATDREIYAGRAAINQVVSAWAKKGFSLPVGTVDRQSREVTEQVLMKTTEINRQQAIERAKLEVENLKVAIDTGTKLEAQLIDSFDKSKERQIKVQALIVEAAVSTLNAQVALFNAKVGAYKVEADVYGERVRASLAYLEQFKLQIEVEKLKLQRSSLTTELYKARMQALGIAANIYGTEMTAVKTQVEAYSEQVNARKSLIDGERLKIEAAELKIKSFGEEVNAYKNMVDATSISNENNQIKAQVYSELAKAHANSIQAYKSEADAKVAIADQQNRVNDFNLQAYSTNLDGIKAKLQQEQTRVQSLISVFDGQSRIYAAEGNVLSSFKQTDIERYKAQVQVASSNAQLLSDKAKLDIEQVFRIAQIEADNAKTAATVYGQVGAATLAGVSMSAGLTESGRWTDNYNENHNYSYAG